MSDSDKTTTDKKDKSNDDLITMFADGISKSNFKKYLITFILFILLSSDVFIENILSTIPDATDNTQRYPTTKGVVIQALLSVFIAIVLDILDNADVI